MSAGSFARSRPHPSPASVGRPAGPAGQLSRLARSRPYPRFRSSTSSLRISIPRHAGMRGAVGGGGVAPRCPSCMLVHPSESSDTLFSAGQTVMERPPPPLRAHPPSRQPPSSLTLKPSAGFLPSRLHPAFLCAFQNSGGQPGRRTTFARLRSAPRGAQLCDPMMDLLPTRRSSTLTGSFLFLFLGGASLLISRRSPLIVPPCCSLARLPAQGSVPA